MTLSFGQNYDDKSGCLFPWFTHGMLDDLRTWDLKDKTILEFGGGASTKWWRKNSKAVITVEANKQWHEQIQRECIEHPNGVVYYVPCNEGDTSKLHRYTLENEVLPEFDIIVNDGILRTEICQFAVDYFKKRNREGILICDNWIQSFVWMSPAAEKMLKPFKSMVYEQQDHKDNDGINKWKTAWFLIK